VKVLFVAHVFINGNSQAIIKANVWTNVILLVLLKYHQESNKLLICFNKLNKRWLKFNKLSWMNNLRLYKIIRI
jgi:hypothetical protein